MSKRATLQQIAAYADVSIATASRCFSNPDLLKPETAIKIRSAAVALNYKAPRVIERDVSIFRVAVFTRLFTHEGDTERLRGIFNALQAWPNELILYSSGDPITFVDCVKRLIVTKRIDALIFFGQLINGDVHSYLEKFHVPTVMLENDDIRFSRILCSDKTSAELVAEYFNRSEFKRILFLGARPDPSNINPGVRLKSFRDKLHRSSKELVTELLVNPNSPNLHSQILKALEGEDRPQAIFADSNDLAVAAFRAARACQIDIPKELSIIGFGDTDTAAKLGLSTVRTHLDATGRRAVEIVRSLRPDSKPVIEVLKPELIHRETSIK